MKDMSKFQLVFTGVFAAFLVIGLLVFALNRSSGGVASMPVTIWGTIDANAVRSVLDATGLSEERTNKITYVPKDPDTFDEELVEALAEGRGPDVVLLPHDTIPKHKNKLFPIPYANYNERKFKDSFIQEAELLMAPEGIYGLPFTVDPMVMYWNRTIFQNAVISQPPKFWDEFYVLAQNLTKKDGALNVTQATVALGEYRNIAHAKEILSLLIMQAGSPITVRENGKLRSVFTERFQSAVVPAEAAVNFYTEFSNPAKSTYTWNRSLPNSKEAFIAGDVAVYFGFASELYEIQAKNPNLNFDVTHIPQSRGTEAKMTFGDMGVFGIVKTSRAIPSALAVIARLTDQEGIQSLSLATRLPPVRRDLLGARPSAAHDVVFYESALWSRGWLDPDDEETDTIFMSMIESITGGRARTTQAVAKASREIEDLIAEDEPEKPNSTTPAAR